MKADEKYNALEPISNSCFWQAKSHLELTSSCPVATGGSPAPGGRKIYFYGYSVFRNRDLYRGSFPVLRLRGLPVKRSTEQALAFIDSGPAKRPYHSGRYLHGLPATMPTLRNPENRYHPLHPSPRRPCSWNR